MTRFDILRLTVEHDGPLHYVKVKVRIEGPRLTIIRSFNKTVEADNAFTAVQAAMADLLPSIEAKAAKLDHWIRNPS